MPRSAGEDAPEARNGHASGALTGDEAVELTRQVANLARSGLPLPSGLRALAEELPDGRLRGVLGTVAGDLEAGETLDEALRSQGERFPAPLRGLVAAGLRTGRLAEALGRFLDVYDLGDSLRRRLRASLIYPTLLVILGSAMFVFVSVTTAMTFEGVFRDFGIDLPWITVEMLTASKAVLAAGWWLIFGPILGVVILWAAMKLLLGRAERARMIHVLPLIGPLAKSTALAQFCPILAMLLESNVPLPEALKLAGESSRDAAMAGAAKEISEDVADGMPLGESLQGHKAFPRGFHAFIDWAGRHRGLVDALRLSAEIFEARAREQAEFVARFCNVLAMVVVLWWVGLTVLALFLPLIDLMNKLGGSGPPPPPGPGWPVLVAIAVLMVSVAALVATLILVLKYGRLLRGLGPLFSGGFILVFASIVAAIGQVYMVAGLAQWLPSWWLEAVMPFGHIIFSLTAGAGLLMMIAGAFLAVGTHHQVETSKGRRVRVPRVIGPKMGLRHMMFAMVPLALIMVLAKNFGWSLLSVLAMLSPPIVVVGLFVILGGRRRLRRDAMLRVMAMAAREGQPLGPAITAFSATFSGGYRKRAASLGRELDDGVPLPLALDHAPKVLSDEGAVIARVGWETHTLLRSLDDAVAAVAARRVSESVMTGTIGYPLAVLGTVLLVSEFFLVNLAAHFRAIFLDYGIPLPRPTRTLAWLAVGWRLDIPLQGLFSVMLGLVVVLLIQCGVLGVIGLLIWRSRWGRAIRDRLLRRRHSAVILRSLAAGIESGQTLPSVLDRLAACYPRAWVRSKLAKTKTRVERGETWWRALAETGLIGRLDAAVLLSASGAGNLPWALREMAEGGERRLTYRLQAIGQVLQTVAVLALGAMSLVVALAYFLPLVTLIQELSGPDL